MPTLSGKVAIVTGGSRGIGKAVCLKLAQEGASVVVAARTEAAGKLPGTIHDTAQAIEKIGGHALPVKCDVSSEEEVADMVEKTLAAFGRIDILVNDAAVAYYQSIMETTVKYFDLVMKVNVRGPFLCMKAVLPYMTAQKSGGIVNISSTAAENVYSRVDRPGKPKRLSGSAYGASKAALERITRGLAEEIKPFNIAVNAVKPGAPTYSEGIAFWNKDVPTSSLRSPDLYMTKAVSFLALQDATGVTGGVFFDDELCQKFALAD